MRKGLIIIFFIFLISAIALISWYSYKNSNSALAGSGSTINPILQPTFNNSTTTISQVTSGQNMSNNTAEDIFGQTNVLREKEGLTVLQWNDQLAQYALSHSIEMLDTNNFSDSNLSGSMAESIDETPINADVVGCGYVVTAEQVATCVIQGWSNDSESNLVSSSYSEVGIGAACNLNHCMITLEFE